MKPVGAAAGGKRVIASIEQPAVIERILGHLRQLAPHAEACDPAHPSRAPPEPELLI